MVLIGLSVLIAWLFFLCYKHPPSSWPVLTWPGWGAFRLSHEESITYPGIIEEEPQPEHGEDFESTADADRQAMPPPDTVTRLSASTPNPSEIQSDRIPLAMPLIPKLTLTSTSPASVSRTSFPAQNSIQRASGGRGPPRTSPMYQLQPPLRSTNSLTWSPPRGPIPSRSSTASVSSFSLAIPPTHHSIPPKPRRKVTLSPGHSPLDWAHISTSTEANLRGLPVSTPYLRVPPSLLRQHTGRGGKNAWTALGGKVYNITPYLPYHSGGELELMKAAGRDGTKLFGEVHPWVNWEGMLEPCLVGIAVGNEESTVQGGLEDMD